MGFDVGIKRWIWIFRVLHLWGTKVGSEKHQKHEAWRVDRHKVSHDAGCLSERSMLWAETGWDRTRHTTTHLNESSVHLVTAQLRDQDSSEWYSRPKPTRVMVLLTASLCHSPLVLFQTCFLSSLPLCFITCPTLMYCTCVSLSSYSSPSCCTRSSLPQCDSSSVISSASSIWIPLSLWLISRVLTYFY